MGKTAIIIGTVLIVFVIGFVLNVIISDGPEDDNTYDDGEDFL